MKNNELQERLFKLVIQQFASKQRAVRALQEVLGKSQDGIYRRLRGATVLTADEIAHLSRTFGISLDALIFNDSRHALFSYQLTLDEVRSIEQYLDLVQQLADRLAAAPEVSVKYSSQEIPVFHYYCFPELYAFKMYVYGRTYWGIEAFQRRKFRLGDRLINGFDKARKISKIYLELPSIEMWNPDLLNHSLNQILYYMEADLFQRAEDALRLCQVIQEMVSWTKVMAEKGHKFLPEDNFRHPLGAYQLYINDFSSTNDTILVQSPRGNTVITSFGTPNFLRSQDERICLEIDRWMNTIIQRSTFVTRIQSRPRELFFNRLQERVSQTQEKVRMQLDR